MLLPVERSVASRGDMACWWPVMQCCEVHRTVTDRGCTIAV